ncbi:hypothetical protein DFAR_3280001 [Desulfarculales bacterium]
MKRKSKREKLASLTGDKALWHNVDISGAGPRPPSPHHWIRCPSANIIQGPLSWTQHTRLPRGKTP